MRKLILILVMVALMLWSPVLAAAKDKNDTNKGVKHYTHGKPFATLQQKIGANEDSIKDLAAAIEVLSNRIKALEDGGTGGGAASYYSTGTEYTVHQSEVTQEFMAKCLDGDQVISGGYSIPLGGTPYIEVIGIGPTVDLISGGWVVQVDGRNIREPVPLTVIAVCLEK